MSGAVHPALYDLGGGALAARDVLADGAAGAAPAVAARGRLSGCWSLCPPRGALPGQRPTGTRGFLSPDPGLGQRDARASRPDATSPEAAAGGYYATGVEAAAEFTGLAPEGVTPAQLALAWIVQQPGVTTVIPGARSPEQARANAAAGKLPTLSTETLAAIFDLYERRIKEQVEGRW